MRTSITGLTALALSMLASPAFAQEEAEDTSSVTISGSATVVTDYRFRGISQTDKDFAVQAGFTVAHDSGFYVSVWGSSVDEYVAAGSDQEIDLIAGFKKTTESGTTFDIGVLYYYYPGAEKFIPGYDSDFIEPYVSVSHTFGPVSGKLTANYAPKSNALSIGNGKEDNLYVAGDLGVGVPNTPVSVSAHLGHSFGPSFLTIGKEYTDWSVGATYAFKNLSFGVAYVDTNKASYSYSGKNIAKAGVVGSIGVSF
ncbi:TorF family putative porin [Sphingobium boeckii]|uniref:Uncharacterized protein (TIGR02001 family) n=1 Tax=Sphingobium boeckii TaxID=1082345 RepID=A0A7W9AFL2_9SPHN|nr:TorF family putative porin [Sphingobium boeckii]MBB5684734.1 uncharacterized protein (TIGR02001 family) [Sphingobium boeckii]